MLVQQELPVDEIIQFYRQNSSNSGGENGSQTKNGPDQQSSQISSSSQPQPQSQPQIQPQPVQAKVQPVEAKKQQSVKTEEKEANLPKEVKLIFIFKNKDQHYETAKETEELFNHDFVKKFRDHVAEKSRLGTLSTLNVEKVLKEFYFEAEKRCSGGGEGEPLLPDVFSYYLLPSYIQAKWEPYNENAIFNSNTKFSCELIVDKSCFSPDLNTENDRIRQRQFENFCKYYQKQKGQRIKSFELDQLHKAVDATKKYFFAIDGLLDTLGGQMEQFTSEVFSSPKGILFYGPPGTGKSAISLKMCEVLEVKLVTTPMAAGDFNKGIVGDSERMLNHIAERAHLIPWETCFLLVDEIDSLAPDRTGDTGQGKDSSLLGVFLAVMDGAKATPNLKIFASTNLREKMDSAFLRRMEIQIFLGNPSAEARISWIKRKSKEAVEQLDKYLSKKNLKADEKNKLEKSKKDINEFVGDEDKMKELQQITLNFSADALRKVLERFFHQIMIGKNQEKKDEDYVKGIMNTQVEFTANEMRVRIGKDLVCKIIKQIDDLKKFNAKFKELFNYIDEGEREDKKELIKVTRRFIIDLSADMKESLQIETSTQFDSKFVELSTKKLENLRKDSKVQGEEKNRAEYINDYRDLAKQFKKFKHIDQNKGREKTLNCYRALFVKNEEYIPSGTEFSPEQDYEHLINSFKQELLNPPRDIDCHKLADNYEQLQNVWLQFIIVLATTYLKADSVKLIDANFLYQNNISDDTGASRLIIDTVNQMKEYSKSVCIFDIDSIAGVSKQFSSMQKEISQPTKSAIEDNEGAQFSYQKIRPNAMDIALKFGQNLLESDNMWIFYITKTKMMTLETKNALNFPLTPLEQDFDDEQGSMDLQRRCGRCLSFFTIRANEEDQCGLHTKQMYRVSQFNKLKHEKQEKQKSNEKQNLKTEFIDDIEIQNQCKTYTKEEAVELVCADVPISDFKYLCCQKQLFEKGEILCTHEEIEDLDNFDRVTLLTGNVFDKLS